MLGKMNSHKENEIQVCGSTMENSPENDFWCLVTFWKCYFSTNFSHFLSHFLSFQTNFITKNFKIYTLTQPKIKIKTFIHNIYMIYSVRGGRRSDRLRERDRSEWIEDGGNQIGWVWGWSGVGWWSMVAKSVMLSKKEKKSWGRREKKEEAWLERSWQWGRHDLSLARAWLVVSGSSTICSFFLLSLSLSLSFSHIGCVVRKYIEGKIRV